MNFSEIEEGRPMP